MKVRWVSFIRIGILLLLTASFALAAPQNTGGAIFAIGSFDRSSGEFAANSPSVQVNFVVSQSTPEKDWYGFHPAVLASASASAATAAPSAARAITFSLSSVAPAYRFRLAVLIENASVPAVRMVINGKTGLFYLHPKLDYSGGDLNSAFNPAYSAADLEFTFPGNLLKTGSNTITLQPIMEASEAVPDAGFNYDAIELSAVAANSQPRLQSAEIDPAIFFLNQNGELKECVDAYVRLGGPIGSGSADLALAGKRYHATFTAGRDFGDLHVQFLVSEFAPQSAARLFVSAGGRRESFSQSVDPKKKWTFLLVPHIHTDVGYSDYQAKVAAIQSRVIDEAIRMTADHPDFRFSLDGQWDLEQFMATRSGDQMKQAVQAFQKKQLYLPAQYASLLTGLPSTEVLIRSLYPSANFSRTFGTPFDYANITDVPSYSWSYASVLAAAGIPYFAAGSDNYRAPVLLKSRLNENTPMWWVGPDNKRVLLWYSRHYMQMQILFGLPPVLAAGRDTLPLLLQMYERPSYKANSVILFGTQVENTDLFPEQAELAGRWNAAFAWPKLQYSGFHDAMQAIEKESSDSIPTIRGDGGPYWEDGAGADAHFVAIERVNEARGQTAEKLATLAALNNQVLRADPAELGRMWNDMVLMNEHTWTSYNSVTDPSSREAEDQLVIKDQTAVHAAEAVDFITRRGMANLANVIPTGTGSIIVFNSLNWPRTGRVCRDLDKGLEIADTGSSEPLPLEVTLTGPNFRRVCFVAKDVPALGYKVYATRATKTEPETAKAEQTITLESPYYKVELDPESGSIRGILDKQLNRELVNRQSPYRFGQYLYVTGGDKLPNSIIHYDPVLPRPELTVHAAAQGKLVSVVHTPSGLVAQLESQALNTPRIKTEIRLFNNAKKIEIVETLDKTEVLTKEAAYFAFPFEMPQPRFQYEIQNGVVDPAHDMHPGAGLEWFTGQHWAAVEQGGVSAAVMPLDAPLLTLGDINRGAWPDQFGARPGNIFSYVMNNYWDTNYRAGQGGPFRFRYIITSAGATDPVALSRIGWEEATPLESDIITTQDKALAPASPNQPGVAAQSLSKSSSGLDAKQGGFLEVEDPSVLVQTWKPAEDGNGTILRFVDLGGTTREITVRTPYLKLTQVSKTDAVERGQTALALDGADRFHFTINPHEIVTIRLISSAK